ncbi:hypothetical protein LARV_01375 [Longilinea arvoryzae]|uniref:Knr4/Smi1-like domain-containing protein n=1 Tax=Longilinea arvoryzae TaxID=360412 RepID=A0A0S7BF86_9CHLR|nr:SMI1/KNR4 family protein [Longilinea arvoryzae]GAP13620.1 hypothetical protein LARV_01375 [Longilinea arvoryzae]
MIDYKWPELLQSWSRHILVTSDYRSYLPEEVIDKQNLWIVYRGASEGQIAQAERRLKTRLLESYREFLKISNGWPTGVLRHRSFWELMQAELDGLQK